MWENMYNLFKEHVFFKNPSLVDKGAAVLTSVIQKEGFWNHMRESMAWQLADAFTWEGVFQGGLKASIAYFDWQLNN